MTIKLGNTQSDHSKALAMLLLANFFWGLSFPLIKALGQLHTLLDPVGGSGWFLTAYTIAPRFLVALILLAVWQRKELLTVRAAEWSQGLTLGLFAGGGMLLQSDGLQYTEASTSAFLTQLYAISIPVWLAFRHRRNPGLRIWWSCALVMAGVAVLGHFDWTHLRFGRGEWETLLCSFFFMAQILCLENDAYRGNRPVQVTFVMFLVEALLFWALAVWRAPNLAALLTPWTSFPWVFLVVVMALLCTLLAFSIMNSWQPKISATEAGLIYCVEPVFGSIMALFLPGWLSLWSGISYANESATWTLLVGGALITLANITVQLGAAKKA